MQRRDADTGEESLGITIKRIKARTKAVRWPQLHWSSGEENGACYGGSDRVYAVRSNKDKVGTEKERKGSAEYRERQWTTDEMK